MCGTCLQFGSCLANTSNYGLGASSISISKDSRDHKERRTIGLIALNDDSQKRLSAVGRQCASATTSRAGAIEVSSSRRLVSEDRQTEKTGQQQLICLLFSIILILILLLTLWRHLISHQFGRRKEKPLTGEGQLEVMGFQGRKNSAELRECWAVMEQERKGRQGSTQAHIY